MLVDGHSPTVTVTVCRGLGKRASGVPANGVAPVARDGVTWPSPVIYSVRSGLRAPCAKDSRMPSADVKMPGPDADTWML